MNMEKKGHTFFKSTPFKVLTYFDKILYIHTLGDLFKKKFISLTGTE